MTRFSSWRWTSAWRLRLLPTWLAAAWLLTGVAPAFAQAIPIERADVNHDCVVNQADLNLVIASYNKRTGQPGFNPDADMDRDGAVTLTDRTFVQRALGTRVCNPQEPAPEISASMDPAPNANGWQRRDVTIAFTCRNAVSCPAPVTVTGEGANQVVDRTVTNTSGATATAHVVVNIDRTPPSLSVTLPASGPPGGSVRLALALASPDLSGFANATIKSGASTIGTLTTLPATIDVPLPSPAGVRTLEIIGTDRAGNVASIVRPLTSAAPDTTAPTVMLSVVDKAAPGAIVPVRVSATDPVGLSQLTLSRLDGAQSIAMGAANGAPFSLQQSFVVPQVADGTTFTFVGRAGDASGNSGTAQATLTVASTADSPTLEVSVDPPVSPTFQSNSVLRGHLRAATGSAPPQPPAFLGSLAPASGKLGDTLDVTITGVNTLFDPAHTQVTFGSGITVQHLTVQSASTVVAHVAIAANAALGPRLVAVSTGSQEALLPNAFSIVAGAGSVSGRVIASTGTPVGSARVCPSNSTTACVDSTATGTFTLPIASTVGRIIATAPTFETASVLVSIAPGGTQALGDIRMVPRDDPPVPPDPGGPVLPPALVTLLARMSGVASDPTSLTAERARKVVIDAVLMVGADELGVLDADGHQLNGDVAGSGPMSLTDAAVAQQARTLRQGATVSLEEMAFALAMAFEWSPPGAPDPDTFVAILQQRVNEAWANPTAPESSLAILLFNQGPTLAKLPPRLSKLTRLNSLQGFLVLSSVVLQGYEAHAGTGSARRRLAPVDVASFHVSASRRWASLGSLGSRRVNGKNTIDATRSIPHVGQSGGGTPTHKVRQLSRLLNDFRAGFASTVAHNLVGSLLFSVPAAIASGSFGMMTLLTAVVGSVTDTFFFAQFIPLIANLAPPPPEVVSVAQTGNTIAIRIQRVPLDIRCRTGLASDPNSQAGLCNFQYTVYRYAAGQKDHIVTARLVPPVREDVAPGVFEVRDAYPQPGMNLYYADVVHKLPLEVPDSVKHIAGVISLPTKIGIPVGSIVGLGFITELVSDYSSPNPYPTLNFDDRSAQCADSSNHDQCEWDRVQARFTPVPPISDITTLRIDHQHGVFANDYGLSQFTQVVPGASGPAALRPGFGRGAGLDLDRDGMAYSVSDTSQGQFGGRMFQVKPTGEQSFVGTVNRYSPLLDIGRPVQVAAIAVGPGIGAGAFVPGDLFVADNSDRTIKRLFTSIIPVQGIGGLPAPGGGIFGAMAASPIVGQPFASFPSCGEAVEPINDILIDRTNTLWALVGASLYQMPADGSGGLTVGATLGGGMTTSSVSIKVRGSVRQDVATVVRGTLHLFAESVPCLGRFEWISSDKAVVDPQTSISGPGSAKADLIGLKPGMATVTVRFTPLNSTITSEATITVTVFDSGPILFVHGWRGKGSDWEPVLGALQSQKKLLRGGSLCAGWVRDRGRFAHVLNNFYPDEPTMRTGNDDQYVCEEPADDGAFFTLNFDDNQNRFIDTGGELADIVNQIEKRLGGDDCVTLPNQTRELPATCPRLTIVAHSMGGQTARAFIQSIKGSPTSVPDYPVGVDATAQPVKVPVPFLPFNHQVRKLITIGTMNFGTPPANLADDETLMFYGGANLVSALSTFFGAETDPFSFAVRSLQVDNDDWHATSTHNLDVLKSLQLTSIVTQAPPEIMNGFCAIVQGGQDKADDAYAKLPPRLRLVFNALAFAAHFVIADFEANVFTRLNERLCLPVGNPTILVPVIGAKDVGIPFMPNSDMIVGVDSQNLNNLFRYLDHHPDGIVHVCRDEQPGVTPGAIAKVTCVQNMLHIEDTGAFAVIIPELGLDDVSLDPGATPSTSFLETQPHVPASASLSAPTRLAVDAVGNIFVSDRVNGSVTAISRNGLANTFITGFDNLGAIAIEGAYLYAARNGDVIRVPLGISGQVVDSTGVPVRGATVIARAAGGVQTPTFTTDAGGGFSTSLDALEAQVSGDRVNIFLTVTTPGTSTVPSQTYEFVVPLDISPQGERTQTIARITLPAPTL